jgi:hypothetical protein
MKWFQEVLSDSRRRGFAVSRASLAGARMPPRCFMNKRIDGSVVANCNMR